MAVFKDYQAPDTINNPHYQHCFSAHSTWVAEETITHINVQ